MSGNETRHKTPGSGISDNRPCTVCTWCRHGTYDPSPSVCIRPSVKHQVSNTKYQLVRKANISRAASKHNVHLDANGDGNATTLLDTVQGDVANPDRYMAIGIMTMTSYHPRRSPSVIEGETPCPEQALTRFHHGISTVETDKSPSRLLRGSMDELDHV